MGLLYSQFKMFHFQEKLDSLPADVDKILPPIHVRIKPTNVCGHNCWYCAFRQDNLQLGNISESKEFIPKDKMLEIIDDFAEMGVKSVTFSGGGDPFYYKYLPDAVKRLTGTKVKFASFTNGARLQGELSEIFAHHATWIRVSIDGWDDASYAKYRDVKEGEYSKVMKNMVDFKKLGGKCYLSVVLVVDQTNASHVYDMVTGYRDIGVDSVKISQCIVSNDMHENEAYQRPNFQSVKEQIARAIEDTSKDKFEIFDAYHGLEGKFAKEYTWCPFLQIIPVIGADMNVYTCHDKAYNLKDGVLGSIKNKSFKEFWFEDKNNFFKTNPAVVCNHHCAVNDRNNMLLEYLAVDKGHMEFI